MSFSSGLVVQGDREHERACLRVVEIVPPTGADARRDRPAQTRLRIVARVVGPRLQVAARDAQVDAREADGALHPRSVDREGDGDLAQLHEASVLDAGLVDPDEGAGGDELVPVLADRHRRAGPWARDRAIPPAALAECLVVADARSRGDTGGALLGVLVGAVAPQCALGAVPDLPAVPDVQQAGDLQLVVAEGGADAAGPVVDRILHDPQAGVLHGEPVRADVERAVCLYLAD